MKFDFRRPCTPEFWLAHGFLLVAPATMVSLPVAALVFVVCALPALWFGRKLIDPGIVPKMLGLAFLAMFVWTAAASIWSTTPLATAFGKSLSFGGLSLLGFLTLALTRRLSEEGREYIEKRVLVGVGLTLAVFIFEISSDYMLTQALYSYRQGQTAVRAFNSDLSRSSVILTIILWTAILVAYRRYGWIPTAVLVAAFLFVLFGNGKYAVLVATGIGTGLFVLTLILPKLIKRALAVGSVLVVVFMPSMTLVLPTTPELIDMHHLFVSARHRIIIWSFAIERIAEKPILGWGMDSSRTMPGGTDLVLIRSALADGEIVDSPLQSLPLHPHNAALQLWLELGVVGSLIFGFIIWAIIAALGRAGLSRFELASAHAMFGATLVIALLSYGIWQTWWLAAMWLCVLSLSSVIRPRDSQPKAAGAD